MARARNIKPGFFTNDSLAELDALTRLLFIGLWTIADRSGRLEDRPKRIKAEVMPYDDCEVDGMLSELARLGFIRRYDAGGRAAIQIVTWDKHQNPHIKEAESTIPAPDSHGVSTVQEVKAGAPNPERAGLIPDSLNRIPDSLTSVPNGTGGDAAKPAEEMTKDELWSAGKSLLMAAGMPKGQCGSFVGKLVKDYGDQVVIDAVRTAVVARPADPAEYLKACCLRSTGKRGPKPLRQAETPEETARMLDERDKKAAPQPAEVRARIAELAQQMTGRKAA